MSVGFDSNDLRVRVQSSFSTGEMKRLLMGWGATDAELEGDANALATRVVRVGFRRFGLAELMHKLRGEKPLTEWPDPSSEPDERWAGPPSRALSQPLSPTLMDVPVGDEKWMGLAPRSAATPEPASVSPGPPSSPAPFALTVHHTEPAQLIPDLGSEPTGSTSTAIAQAPASQAAPSAPASAPVSQRSAAAPPSSKQPHSRGLIFSDFEAMRAATSPARQPSGVSYRTLAIAGGLVLLLGLLAFGGGLLWQARRGSRIIAAPSIPDRVNAEGRGRGPAGRAADLIDTSLLRVADLCGLTVTGTPSTEIFALSQAACSREEVQREQRSEERKRARRALGIDDPDFDPTPPARTPADDIDDALDEPPPPRRPAPRPTPNDDPAPVRRNPATVQAPPSCTAKCQSARSDCDASCGREPADASLYDRFQACTGACISQETRCRRACL